nr:MAG TPA: hypothetical protein [Caudoviricetes sp.]
MPYFLCQSTILLNFILFLFNKLVVFYKTDR